MQSLHMVRHTLDHMARGGIYDHLAGGFARYSTDDRWLVPHFEKMLYDNALLDIRLPRSVSRNPGSGLRPSRPRDAGLRPRTDDRATGRLLLHGGRRQRRGGRQISTSGAFRRSTTLLGPERARTFANVYDVTESGNWEGNSILNMPKPFEQVAEDAWSNGPGDLLRTELDEDRGKLLEAREQRVPPGMDTKMLASWNGLMIAALAEGGRVLRRSSLSRRGPRSRRDDPRCDAAT